MNIPVLVIRVAGTRVGLLFKYAPENMVPTQRFQVDENYAAQPFEAGPLLSESMRANDPAQQRAYWLDLTARRFNGETGPKGEALLPSFFQNLLPEGMMRRHVAELANIEPNNFFALLAACGKDLPGNVTALWEDLGRDTLEQLITQGNDALEMSVWTEPFQDAISISGIQPKLGVNRSTDGRFVGRTSLHDTSIIAKLPAPDYPRMPEVEHTSMTLARASGIHTCEFSLEPMHALQAPHRYDLGEQAQGHFLAVTRFDRGPGGRVHMEDFAQILGVQPDNKYTKSYIEVASVLLDLPACGEDAVIELIRRIAFNDLIGNADMHLKNIAVIYPDGRTAQLSPAYDLVAQCLYQPIHGHALHLFDAGEQKPQPKEPLWTPARLRAFCEVLGMNEKRAQTAMRDMVRKTLEAAPEIIVGSGMTPRQKSTLLRKIHDHEHAQSLFRRVKSLQKNWAAPMKATSDLL